MKNDPINVFTQQNFNRLAFKDNKTGAKGRRCKNVI